MFNHKVLPLPTRFGATSTALCQLQIIPKNLSQPEQTPRPAKMPKNLLLPSGQLTTSRPQALYISLLPA